MKSLVILTESPSNWHLNELKQAAESRDWTVCHCPLHALWLDTAAEPWIHFPPNLLPEGLPLPDAVWVRSIAAGSFEQITFRLGLLHGLGRLGVRVINSARAIEGCVDKSMTSFLLAAAGIPQPLTRVSEDREVAASWGPSDLVIKPLFGAMGQGLRRFTPPEIPEDTEWDKGVWYYQQFIASPEKPAKPGYCDYRLLIAQNQLVAAMSRENSHWITNYAQGGICQSYEPSPREIELAIAATQAVGATYSGVDLIHDADNQPLVIEVNSMPAWHGLQTVTKCTIALSLVDKVL